jgi:hypothetical protein
LSVFNKLFLLNTSANKKEIAKIAFNFAGTPYKAAKIKYFLIDHRLDSLIFYSLFDVLSYGQARSLC